MRKYCCVVVTFNRLQLLKECMDALKTQTLSFSKVFIVNNSSTDGTTEYLKTINDELFDIINLDKNIGGAGGFSEGLKKFTEEYDWCLLIDDDAILEKNFLYEIDKSVAKNCQKYLSFSGTVMVDGNIDVSHRKIVRNRCLLKTEPLHELKYSNPENEIDLASFCGLFISHDLFVKIGYPEKDFFIWYDDTEYCYRFHKYSKILNISSAKLNHKTIVNSGKKFDWKSYYGYRNSYVTGVKHSNCVFIFKIYNFFYLCMLNCYYFICICINKNRNDAIHKLKAHNLAYKDGRRNHLGKSEVYFPGCRI